MQITRDLDSIGESFVFDEIDGKGQLFSFFNGAITGQLNDYWSRGSLYGLSADEAFFVDTGESVNTPSTIANGQIIASVGVKMSPQAEFVTINITKYSVAANLPA
jgi:phage tail sheath protein FI